MEEGEYDDEDEGEEDEWDDFTNEDEEEGELDTEEAEESELDEALLELEAACETGDEDACEELASIFMDDETDCDDEDDVEDAEVETPEI